MDMPVIFPPGSARLATKPNIMGSFTCAITMGIVALAFLGSSDSPRSFTDDNVNSEPHELSGEIGIPRRFTPCRAVLKNNVLALDVTEVP